MHLQCHLGTETLSLARAGAEVTGVDFSPPRWPWPATSPSAPARRSGSSSPRSTTCRERWPARRSTSSTPTVGTINWLPSIARWAEVVAGLLRPGGRLYLRDGHPMLATLDDERDDDLLVVTHPYGAAHGPQRWVTEVSYTGRTIASPSP